MTLAGAETGEEVMIKINGAGEFAPVIGTESGKVWKDGPQGIGWYFL